MAFFEKKAVLDVANIKVSQYISQRTGLQVIVGETDGTVVCSECRTKNADVVVTGQDRRLMGTLPLRRRPRTIGACLTYVHHFIHSHVSATYTALSPQTLEHLVFLGSKKYPYKGVLDMLASRCLAQGTNAWTDVRPFDLCSIPYHLILCKQVDSTVYTLTTVCEL
jgi:hypothetical protein